MSKRSLASIINGVVSQDDEKYESHCRRCHRLFNRFIQNIGGNLNDLKNENNTIEFEESEIPGIEYLIQRFYHSDSKLINDFLKLNPQDITIDEIKEFIDKIAEKECKPEEEEAKKELVYYLYSIFGLSSMRIIENCHYLVDLYACNMEAYPRTLRALSLGVFRDMLARLLAAQLVLKAKNIADISEYIELYKDGEEEIDCIYDNLPDSIKAEYVQRDIESLKAIQEDDDLRVYVEKKTGKKAEDIFNYKALTDITLIFKKKDTEN